jgi:hypothetical protein
MTDLEINWDEQWPTHAVFAEVLGDITVRVTVSPNVEARALALLDEPIRIVVAERQSQLPGGAS